MLVGHRGNREIPNDTSSLNGKIGRTIFDDLVELVISGVGMDATGARDWLFPIVEVLSEDVRTKASLSFFLFASGALSVPFLFTTC